MRGPAWPLPSKEGVVSSEGQHPVSMLAVREATDTKETKVVPQSSLCPLHSSVLAGVGIHIQESECACMCVCAHVCVVYFVEPNE